MRYIYIIDGSKVVMIKEPTPQDYKYFNSLEDNDLDHDDDDADDHVHTVDDVRRHGHHVVAPPLPSYHQPFSRSIDDHDDINMMNAMTINNNVHPNQLFNQPLYTGTPASSAVVDAPSTTTAAAAVAVHSTNSSVDHHHRSSSTSSNSSSRRQEVISTSSIAPSSIAISMAPPPAIVMSQHKVDVPVSTAFTVELIDDSSTNIGKVVKPMPIALRRKMIADQQHQQQLGEVLDDVDDDNYDDDDDHGDNYESCNNDNDHDCIHSMRLVLRWS